MSTVALPLTAASSTGLVRTLRIFASEARYDFVRMVRNRTFSLSVIGFPVMFYCLFGLMLNRGASVNGQSFARAITRREVEARAEMRVEALRVWTGEQRR